MSWRTVWKVRRTLLGLGVLAGLCMVAWGQMQGPDADEDGIADAYEQFFGLDPSDPTDAGLDPDLDTLSNASEGVLVTDPHSSDTDLDGWRDDMDASPVSRAVMIWGDPQFTYDVDYAYAAPGWWTRAYRVDGQWLATNGVSGWHVPAESDAGVGSLNVVVDRTMLTNNLVMDLSYLDQTGSSLYIDLCDAGGTVVVSDVRGNLMTGSALERSTTSAIPLAGYADATAIRLRRGEGEITVWRTIFYVDDDGDGLDREQEAQLGTLDTNADSDGDGMPDRWEAGHRPAVDPTVADANGDPDGDALSNVDEYEAGTDPGNADTDADGMSDGWEVQYGLNPLAAADAEGHADGDGLTNLAEFQVGTDPTAVDTDGDGMPDGWEVRYGLTPLNAADAMTDLDGDGLSNLAELQAGTTPTAVDSDGDGLPDGWEVGYGLSALSAADGVADPDADGLPNLAEFRAGTHPWVVDSDGNGVPDGLEDFDQDGLCNMAEVLAGTNPGVQDSDSDGVLDGLEDPDGEGLPNVWEFRYGLNPGTADSDTNGVTDAEEDLDADGLNCLAEYQAGTDPTNPDSDGDGMSDGWEAQHGLNPLDAADAAGDVDGDGLNNAAELQAGTDPTIADSDGDGMPDGWEAQHGLNPLAAADAAGDGDGDGLNNLAELQAGSNPTASDSDGDGMPDGWEAQYGLNPLDAADAAGDADGDGLNNLAESQVGTNPTAWDTDTDEMSDGWEAIYGLNPLAAADATVDGDGDGLNSLAEFLAGTDPTVADSDGDGMPDGWEAVYGLTPLDPGDAAVDSDGDGASNVAEFNAGANPLAWDTDGDGMPDGWELSYGFNPASGADASGDSDGDALANAAEYLNGTDPSNPDTDQDGMPDGWEVSWLQFANPLALDATTDADGDGVANGDEYRYGTNPGSGDTDGDGMGDQWEVQNALDPCDPADAAADPDHDGLASLLECQWGTNPMAADTDADGMPDKWETDRALNPLDPSDAAADWDGDRVNNVIEWMFGLEPWNPDTDGDGLSDIWEIQPPIDALRNHEPGAWNADTDGDGLLDVHEARFGASWYNADTDGDGLMDGDEVARHLKPYLPDSDGDGFSDGVEVLAGMDPHNPDTDQDGLTDGQEVFGQPGVAPTDPANRDTDGDRLWDGEEVLIHGTSPTCMDTDGDYVNDGAEVEYGWAPTVPQNWGYGVDPWNEDWWHYFYHLNYPWNGDADKDGTLDYQDPDWGSGPAPDGDGDGLCDWLEQHILGTGSSSTDSDGDGLSDGVERMGSNSDPLDADTDDDLRSDGAEVRVGRDPGLNDDVDIFPPSMANASADDFSVQCVGSPAGTAVSSSQVLHYVGMPPWATSLMLWPILLSNEDPGWPSDQDSAYDDSVSFNVSRNGQLVAQATHTVKGDWVPAPVRIDLTTTNGALPVVELAGTAMNVGDSSMGSGLRLVAEYLPTLPGNEDFDHDGLSNAQEYQLGTSMRNPDTDGDGMPDVWEARYVPAVDPTVADANADPDADGLTNSEEYEAGTDPTNADTDGDGMSDSWELSYGFNPLDAADAASDSDADGLPNLAEFQAGTHPWVVDSDGDGVPDRLEDADGDGLCNAAEVLAGTNPGVQDSDDDGVADALEDSDSEGLPNAWEFRYGLNPGVGDSDTNGVTDAQEDMDGDGLDNMAEFQAGTDPTNPDSDGDGMPDGWEAQRGFDPMAAADAAGDADGDGLSNLAELQATTSPTNWDTDADGMPDGWELTYGLNPLDVADGVRDPDGDRVLNLAEFLCGTHPWVADSDGDGILDGQEDPDGDGFCSAAEALAETDPNNPDSDGDGLGDAGEDSDGDQLTNGWEFLYGLNPGAADGDGNGVRDDKEDMDGDGLCNLVEMQAGTDPSRADTDGNGVLDGLEDPDGDGLRNWAEQLAQTSPILADTDTNGVPDGAEDFEPEPDGPDGLTNAWECLYGLDPRSVDSDTNGVRDGLEDWDGDQLDNLAEMAAGTNPRKRDTDGDGLPDAWELLHGMDPLRADADADGVRDDAADADGDGLSNLEELLAGTDTTAVDTNGDGKPDGWDSDHDGMPDGWEVQHGLNPLGDDSAGDADGDGLSNLDEFVAGTDPQNSDSDGDGISDNWEVQNGLDPLSWADAALDADGDGLPNLAESQAGTNPRANDSDGDGLWDGSEDSDGDGLLNSVEVRVGTNLGVPDMGDFDGDGLTNDWESSYGLDPLAADTDGNGVADADDDGDHDGLKNLAECQAGTDPTSPDSDGDRLRDGWEVQYALDPLADDAAGDGDGDGLSNLEEQLAGTNPTAPDTDGDGMPDGWEQAQSLNPVDPADGRGDPDNDGLVNVEEYRHATDPWVWDTDNDGLDDGWECYWSDWVPGSFNPNSPPGSGGDAEGDIDLFWQPDGLVNRVEYALRTNPLYDDSDWDGLPDKYEIENGFDPNDWKDAGWDPDGDGLTTRDEYEYGKTNPRSADSDGDGMPDGWEYAYRPDLDATNPADAGDDPDHDGLCNYLEYMYNLNPLDADSDDDGVDDLHDTSGPGRTPPTPTLPDADKDGLTDAYESLFGCLATTNDTDGDGLSDGYEVAAHLVPYLNVDTNADGVLDISDTDNDGIDDGTEVRLGRDPNCADTDQDGLSDKEEARLGTDPTDRDTDGDSLWDGEEVYGHGTDPLDYDSDGDIRCDSQELGEGTDPNEDGGYYAWEAGMNDNPSLYFDLNKDGTLDMGSYPPPPPPDSDGDGLCDWYEAFVTRTAWRYPSNTNAVSLNGVVPLANGLTGLPSSNTNQVTPNGGFSTNAIDTDCDGLSDYQEVMLYNTLPLDPDTDGDGRCDGDEVRVGRDPRTNNEDPHLLDALASDNVLSWECVGCGTLCVSGEATFTQACAHAFGLSSGSWHAVEITLLTNEDPGWREDPLTAYDDKVTVKLTQGNTVLADAVYSVKGVWSPSAIPVFVDGNLAAVHVAVTVQNVGDGHCGSAVSCRLVCYENAPDPEDGDPEPTYHIDLVGHQPGRMADATPSIDESLEDSPANLVLRVNDDRDGTGANAPPDNADTAVKAVDDDIVRIRLNPPVPFPTNGTVTLSVMSVSGADAARLFDATGSNVIPSGLTVDLAAPTGSLAALGCNLPVDVFLEALAPADLQVELSFGTGRSPASDVLRLALVRASLDADTDNLWTDVGAPSEPPDPTPTNHVKNGAVGVAVGLADDDTDNNKVEDRCEDSLVATNAGSAARLAKMAHLVGSAEGIPSYATVRARYNETILRLWQRTGDDYALVPNYGSLNMSEGPTLSLYAEGVGLGSDSNVAIEVVSGSGAVCAEDRITVTVYPVPAPFDFTKSFTPGQSEAPPYHMAKFDAGMPANAGPNPFAVALLIRQSGATDWSSFFYRRAIPYATPESDTPIYSALCLYDVSALHSVANAVRLCWDGRQDSNGDGAHDVSPSGAKIWASRPGHIQADPVTYDVLVATLVGHRPLARLIKYASPGSGAAGGTVPLEVATSPLERDHYGRGILGPAPYYGYYRGQVNSKHRSLSLSEPSIGINAGVGPLPRFTCYYNGLSWRYSDLGYGWTHSLNIRVVPAWVGDQRQIYLQWLGDHLLGPANSDNEIYIFGERAGLVEKPDGTWELTTRDRQVYRFTEGGQLTGIEDRNGNTLTVKLGAYPNAQADMLIRRIEGCSAPAVGATLSLKTKSEDGVRLASAKLGDRTISFDYGQCEGSFNYKEALTAINGPEYDVANTWAPETRTNQASRAVPGGIRQRAFTGAALPVAMSWHYEYETGDAVPMLVSSTRVARFYAGSAANKWLDAIVSDGSATLGNGTVIEHGYANKSLCVTRTKGSLSESHSYQYNANDQLTQEWHQAGDASSGVTYTHDADGNLTQVQPDGCDATVYQYHPTQNALTKITRPLGRVVDFGLDANGNVVTKTQYGDGQALPPREWIYERNSDGTIATEQEPGPSGPRTITYQYKSGRLVGMKRGAQVLLDHQYDDFGNVVKSADAKKQATTWQYDKLDRVVSCTYPSGEFEEWSFTPTGRAWKHRDPAGALEVVEFDEEGKPKGASITGPNVNYQAQYTGVDDEGLVTDQLVQNDLRVQREYDQANRLVREVRGVDTVVGTWRHDAQGRVVEATDGCGNTTLTAYDSRGLVVRIDRPAGMGAVTISRDLAGNPTTVSDDPDGEKSGLPPSVTVNTYDVFDRLVSTTDPRGGIWTRTYDQADNLLTETDPENNVTTHAYNPANDHLAQSTLADGTTIGVSTDPNGDIVGWTDAKGKTWGRQVDGLGRTRSVTPPDGPATVVDRNLAGVPTNTVVGGLRTVVSLDALSRPRVVTPPGDKGSITSTFKADGSAVTVDRDNLTTEETAGLDGRVSVVQRGDRKALIDMDGNYRVTRERLTVSDNPKTYLDRTRNLTYGGLGDLVGESGTAGSTYSAMVNGHGVPVQEQTPHVGTVEYGRDEGDLVTSITLNGTRTTTIGRDDVGNPISVDPPGAAHVAQQFDPRGRLARRTTVLGSALDPIEEVFTRDVSGNIVKHHINGPAHTTTFSYDDANRLTAIVNADGKQRLLSYAPNGQQASDACGGTPTTYGYDTAGRLASLAVAGCPAVALEYDNEGRLIKVLEAGTERYGYQYDGGKFLKEVQDLDAGLGGLNVIGYEADAAGYAWKRTLPPSALTLVQEVNDIDAVTTSTLGDRTVTYALLEGVRPGSLTRPGSVPDSTWSYNTHKEMLGANHGPGCGVDLVRNADSGLVEGRTAALGTNSLQDQFGHNAAGWITSESRPGWQAEYAYRGDGVRQSYTLNGRTAQFVCSDAGRVREVRNAQLGRKLRAPYEGKVWTVGAGAGCYTSIEAAVSAVYSNVGSASFTKAQVIVVDASAYASDVVIGPQLGALHPTESHPLIIRSKRDQDCTLSGHVLVEGIPHVRLQGFVLPASGPAGVVYAGAAGAQLASCVVRADAVVSNCPGARIVGNTFDYSAGGGRLMVAGSAGTLVRNNVFLSDGTTAAYAKTNGAVDSGRNCFWPAGAPAPVEVGSVYGDPMLAGYCISGYASPIRGAGEPVPGFDADCRGWYRHRTHPCMGAMEYEVETTACDSAGRIATRTVAGRDYEYKYSARGQLTSYTDSEAPAKSATYAYDHLGRRVRMTVGGAVQYRFVYDGDDVAAEYVDVNNDGTPDRRRTYWRLPDIDQRVGFVDIAGDGSQTFYYYLCDQVGSVLQVVRYDGVVVNQYDYDAFGNVRWDSATTFEGVPNRYTFQGREWDDHRSDYYHRMRTYVPEWGCFTGPDMNLDNGVEGEPEGVGNYLFCRNDPVDNIDPLGLWGIQIGRVSIGVGSPTLAFGDIGVDVGDASFSKGWTEGRTIAANTLSFGISKTLDAEAQALVAKGGVYRASAASARIGRSMLLAAGGGAAIQGTMAGLGSLAAQGGAIGQAATIARAGAEVGLAAAAARSAGDNLGTAVGEAESGHGAMAALHATLGVVDMASAGSSGYGATRDLSVTVAREAARGASVAAKGSVQYGTADDAFLANASRATQPAGMLDVSVHGTASSVDIGANAVNHRVLAGLIEGSPQFDGQPIRLLSCNTGRLPNGFAQNLANKLGVPVHAPNDLIWAFPNGRLTIGPTPAANSGAFVPFLPGGGRP